MQSPRTITQVQPERSSLQLTTYTQKTPPKWSSYTRTSNCKNPELHKEKNKENQPSLHQENVPGNKSLVDDNFVIGSGSTSIISGHWDCSLPESRDKRRCLMSVTRSRTRSCRVMLFSPGSKRPGSEHVVPEHQRSLWGQSRGSAALPAPWPHFHSTDVTWVTSCVFLIAFQKKLKEYTKCSGVAKGTRWCRGWHNQIKTFP